MKKTTCNNCNIEFEYKDWRGRKYCSQDCYKVKRVRSLSDGFELHVIRNPEGCWDWKGYRKEFGYGSVSYKNKEIRAHRASWIIHFGEIPEGMFVCHKCDNPICSNPKHLFLGTAKDNSQDSKLKGRNKYIHRMGEEIGTSKLTNDLVREIIISKESSSSMAKRLGIGHRNINRIRQRKLWKHIEI